MMGNEIRNLVSHSTVYENLKDSFLRALRDVAPEMKLFLEIH